MTVGTSSPALVEADIDRYGSDARVSALADYVELAALSGYRVTRARLQDLIVDNEWVRRPTRRYLLPDDVEDDPESWADAVFSMLSEREAVLGDLYPFVEQGRALKLKTPGFSRLDSPYLALLAITVVHAWELPCATPAESTLESVVASTLGQLGISAVGIGATDRGTGFVDALAFGGAALALRPMIDPRPRSRSAKDAGVDTLAGVVWRDYRPAGHWLFIGQVTVGKSQSWREKLNQPDAPRWAKFLQEPLHPQVFLAIPHHAQDDHIRDLMAGQRGIIIDRLRLVGNKPENTPAERSLIEAMLDASVTGP
ncbi:hypothetical protein [Agromyces sp. LHK192]|uniref:hypothetical protein n=1 Tax=Agromyces sp. LHK192 TaxID=2498704 RepID=UPI000FDCC594|nr:hypothetical protein [Agromyces sp. LHK192]